MLKNMIQSWRQLSDRDQKILLGGSIIVLLILILKYALFPLITWREDVLLQLNTNQTKLEKMVRTINTRSQLENEKSKLLLRQKQIEQGLVMAKDADIASAEIIKTLRTLAQNAGISTSRISSNKTKSEEGLFQEVSLSIPSMRCDMKQLYNFLLNIKKSPLIFSIIELRIRVTNMKDPAELSVNMDISGFMVKPAAQAETSGTEDTRQGRS